jgi:diacylglycerol kinase (ATP)
MAAPAEGASQNPAIAVAMAIAVVIVNPLSGRGRYEADLRSHAELATTMLATWDIEATVRTTTAAGDANRFAREAADQGADVVIAWGGDGTVNEAACALVHTGVPLAIVPAGSGNGLASDLGLPFDPTGALKIAATGVDLHIDAGQVHNSVFFNIAGIGVDAIIAARFAERGLRKRGPLGYLQVGLAEFLRYRSQVYTLSIDDDRHEHLAMLIAIANGRQYGNRVQIAPGARLDDGLLELVIVEELSTVAVALRLPSLFRGTLKAGNGVTMRAVSEMVVHTHEPIPFHVDGEPRLGPPEIRVTTLPKALIVKVPKAYASSRPTAVPTAL